MNWFKRLLGLKKPHDHTKEDNAAVDAYFDELEHICHDETGQIFEEHSWEILHDGGGKPIKIQCRRCMTVKI